MVYNLCVAEKYKDKNGEDKLSWNRIGVMFESKGKQYMKLYHMLGTLISVFEPKPKETEGSGEAF
jgi:hypothetical protein